MGQEQWQTKDVLMTIGNCRESEEGSPVNYIILYRSFKGNYRNSTGNL